MPGWKVNVHATIDGKAKVRAYLVNVADQNEAIDAALMASGSASHTAIEAASDEMIKQFNVAPGEAKHVLTIGSDGMKTPKAN